MLGHELFMLDHKLFMLNHQCFLLHHELLMVGHKLFILSMSYLCLIFIMLGHESFTLGNESQHKLVICAKVWVVIYAGSYVIYALLYIYSLNPNKFY